MSIACKTLKVLESNSVVEIVLNRPDVRNAFNPLMIKELTDVFKKVGKRNDLRAVIFKGEGKSFCAGGDLHWMQEMVKYSLEKNKKDSKQLFEMFDAIAKCAHPVIGIVHGAVFGGGVGLAACCDIVIAEEDTQFCFSEVKLGLAPAVISHFVLRKTTLGLATPWMLMGRAFSAREAQFLGLAHLIVKTGESQSMVKILLDQLKEVGPEAVRETKKLIAQIPRLTDAKSKTQVTKVIAARRISKEGLEGMKSFLEKRSPSWKVRS